MTRIVSGAWSGRRLQAPADRRVRPTAERVREAWLNILGHELRDARVLDLCAGTGALGLEMLSRGASHATFVEQHPDSLRILRANIAALGAEQLTTVERGDALRFVRSAGTAQFDIAVADPPFESTLAAELVAAWRSTPFAPLFSVEHASRDSVGGTVRRWGDISVSFFRAP